MKIVYEVTTPLQTLAVTTAAQLARLYNKCVYLDYAATSTRRRSFVHRRAVWPHSVRQWWCAWRAQWGINPAPRIFVTVRVAGSGGRVGLITPPNRHTS